MEHKQLIIKALKKGISERKIAKSLGIHHATFWGRIKNDKEIKDVITERNIAVSNILDDIMQMSRNK